MGTSGPVLLTILPPIRRFFGDVDPEPIPLTYPSKDGLLSTFDYLCWESSHPSYALSWLRLRMSRVFANMLRFCEFSPARTPQDPARLR